MRRRMITAASSVIVLGMSVSGGGMVADAAATSGNVVVNDATVSSGGFESFDLGDINNQQGWTKTGPYDVNIVDPSTIDATMGMRALQLSNAVVSGSFGDQTFSAPLADEAGETSADNGGTSGGTRQRVFTATMAVRTTSAAVQPGLHATISPDRGDGARMAYLRLEDQADGVHVFFDDYSHSLNNFRETDVATLTRGATHTLGLTMIFVDGIANDVVRVSVDGSLVHTGTSWEDYYRDVESNPTRTVDSLLFREAGVAAPATIGNGFLVDDVVLTSGPSEPCAFSTTSSTITLLSDCTTDQTIMVPNGMTLDGDNHQITAVDPDGGHFLGAVVQNAGPSANVQNLRITATLATACDAYPNSLAGIRLDGAAGWIMNNTVTGLQQGLSGDGCQEGNAIEVRNTSVTGIPSVTVTGNTVSKYQKTGIIVSGKVSAVVVGNTVTGYGPVDFIAQNGIQVSRGATARVGNNTISDNFYTPKSYTACGLIIYKAGGVLVEKTNTYSGNEKNVCTYGKGGTYSTI
ncbi:MAG: DUF1565 domain-containing protein [Actinomycetia bacterium]|nr:DUF1565 domain-containing protein [Actinomycetes bacterium]